MGNKYTFFLTFFFLIFFFPVEIFRVGSLNVNGMRDKKKAETILELIKLKNLDVIFLQETHSDFNNETDWRLWWRNDFFFFFF